MLQHILLMPHIIDFTVCMWFLIMSFRDASRHLFLSLERTRLAVSPNSRL